MISHVRSTPKNSTYCMLINGANLFRAVQMLRRLTQPQNRTCTFALFCEQIFQALVYISIFQFPNQMPKFFQVLVSFPSFGLYKLYQTTLKPPSFEWNLQYIFQKLDNLFSDTLGRRKSNVCHNVVTHIMLLLFSAHFGCVSSSLPKHSYVSCQGETINYCIL